MTRPGLIVRGFSSLVALAMLGAGVPVLLVRYGSWPTIRRPPADWWERATEAVLSDSMVFTVLTVAAGLAWLTFAATVFVELMAGLQRRTARRIAIAGPMQRVARMLVVSLLMATSLDRGQPVAASASWAAADETPVATFDTSVAVPAWPDVLVPAALRSEREAAQAPTVVVERGDTAWRLAEDHLGDGLRWRELWELNRAVVQPDGRAWTDPQVLLPGWQLRVPITPPNEAPDDEPVLGTGVHVVAPGESLSKIAQQHLGDARRYVDLFEANRDRPQPDGRRLTDPGLIRPGWQIIIPTAAPPAPTSGSVPDPPADAPEASSPGSAPATPPASTTTPTSSSTSTSAVHHADASDGPGNEGSDESGAGLPLVLAGISGAVVLATGLARRAVRLRRRRVVRGAREARVQMTPTEGLLSGAGDVPFVQWAAQSIAELVGQLDTSRITAAPAAVELTEEVGLEVLWDCPQGAPAPPGWTVADGGWAWRRTYDPALTTPANHLPAGIPALVTIGQRDGRQLMIDLEATGVLSVSGPEVRVDELLRSIATELATGDDLSDAFVSAVGIELGLDGLDGRLRCERLADAMSRLVTTSQSVLDDLQGAKLSTTFAARTRDPVPIETTIIVAAGLDREGRDRLTRDVPPRAGVAVVLSSSRPAADGCAHITIDDLGAGRLEPLGISFQPAGLPAETTAAVDDVVRSLVNLPEDVTTDLATNGSTTAEGPEGAIDEEASPSISDDVSQPPLLNEDEVAAPELLVRVLGPPAIPDRPKLGRRELILAALLACRREPLATSAVQDALWGGTPVEAKTVWNLVASTRRALGTFADGSPVMPSADRARGRLRLDPRVSTDADLLVDYVDAARTASSSEAIQLLRNGLALVEGQPFDAPGYDWAHRDQDVAAASMAIEQAVELLVSLSLEAGMLDIAREAITRGLRGLPGDEQLYRCRMRVEHQAGQRAAIAAAYQELTAYLADLDVEPSPTTTALYNELMGGSAQSVRPAS